MSIVPDVNVRLTQKETFFPEKNLHFSVYCIADNTVDPSIELNG